MLAKFGYATTIGIAIGAAFCAMENSPLTAWINTWMKDRTGLVVLGVASGVLAGSGAIVIGGAILGLGVAFARIPGGSAVKTMSD
jgi:hypothetical protein